MLHAGSDFLAGGAPGHGEAAAGDHLQTGWHLWLVGQTGTVRGVWSYGDAEVPDFDALLAAAKEL